MSCTPPDAIQVQGLRLWAQVGVLELRKRHAPIAGFDGMVGISRRRRWS